jgi:hypothetical protein
MADGDCETSLWLFCLWGRDDEQQNIKRSAVTTQTDLFGYGTVYMVKVTNLTNLSYHRLSCNKTPRLFLVFFFSRPFFLLFLFEFSLQRKYRNSFVILTFLSHL